jgi:hypothetical protein
VVEVVKSVAEQQGATPAGGTCRGEPLTVTLTSGQLDTLDAAGAAVSGNRFEDLTWVSVGRE